ncbi:Ran exchange factor Prp20/Pim1 [Aspergillus ellipticus CBS 707.79]|uniref:Ran exchange factor Prp20/Pim1 n=1 Tax=Aspergillus ellipticus CBS 707.79 TaxID=1448320 RepID=A0A319DJQ6_9EURO|nr:Ran exchange factor Prp20/Pim1 [Aspergillus ellipticus CBS 707.79]
MPPNKSTPKAASGSAVKHRKAAAVTTSTITSATKNEINKQGRPEKNSDTDNKQGTIISGATTKEDKTSNILAGNKMGIASEKAPRKRKEEAGDERESTKKARVAKPRAPKPKVKVILNHAPTTRLNVYVCGEGSSGELGLGSANNTVGVKRPRLNPHLPADRVGVVQVAAGGMHCIALTYDNKILTWGVNDHGALGRDTSWDGSYKDINKLGSETGSDSDDDLTLNPYESTPIAISSEIFPDNTIFVEVAAGDSSSFALTDDGQVYGWGTFRSNDGILGFDASHKVQLTPKLIPSLKEIKHLVCGDSHALALNSKGAVFSWGSGQQNQLGRRIIERNKLNGLQPREFGLPKNIIHIGCGAFHSFAVHQSGKVYAWGLNSFGETGIRTGAGDDEAAIVQPTVVDSLSVENITQICGGAHHSLAITSDDRCLVWGRLDGYQTGLKINTIPEEAVIKDEHGHPRILIKPIPLPGIKASIVAAGSDHSISIDIDGRPWSWGFSATYQTGQGTQDDIEVAAMIENTAVRGKKLNWSGAGGQFSIFTEPTAH